MKIFKAMKELEDKHPLIADIIGVLCLFAMMPIFTILLYGFLGK